MNDPRHIDNLERRIEKLEQDRDGIVENEKALLRLARYHRAALQELNTKLEVEMGDVRERFDTIERGQAETNKRLSTIEEKQDTHTEVLGQILNLLQTQKKEESLKATPNEPPK